MSLVSRVATRGRGQMCHRFTLCQGQDFDLYLQLTPWPNTFLFSAELWTSTPSGKAKHWGLSSEQQSPLAELQSEGRKGGLADGAHRPGPGQSPLDRQQLKTDPSPHSMLCEGTGWSADWLPCPCWAPFAPVFTQRLTSWEPQGFLCTGWGLCSDKSPFFLSSEPCPRHCQASFALPEMCLWPSWSQMIVVILRLPPRGAAGSLRDLRRAWTHSSRPHDLVITSQGCYLNI
jgi:hypothetical protein